MNVTVRRKKKGVLILIVVDLTAYVFEKRRGCESHRYKCNFERGVHGVVFVLNHFTLSRLGPDRVLVHGILYGTVLYCTRYGCRSSSLW